MTDEEPLFVVHPNPAKDIINIQANEDMKFVDIYNIEGKLIKKVNLNSTNSIPNNIQISVSELPDGLYLIRGVSSNREQTYKISVVKSQNDQ
jgi:flagellar hook assembly protein FlgD